MKEYFSFQHDYYKLKDWAFTTIRGKSAAKQYKEGQEVKIIHSNKSPSGGCGRLVCRAEVVGIEVKKIADIPLDILQRDAEFNGFKIYNHWDFVGLLNSMRPYTKIKSLDTEVTLFQLVKTE